MARFTILHSTRFDCPMEFIGTGLVRRRGWNWGMMVNGTHFGPRKWATLCATASESPETQWLQLRSQIQRALLSRRRASSGTPSGTQSRSEACFPTKVSAIRLTVLVFGVLSLISQLASAQSIPILDAGVHVKPPLNSLSDEENVPHAGMSRFIGGRSCASSGCHGDPRRETVVGAAAAYYFDRDRHQFAGTILRNQRSRNIAQRLNLPTEPWDTRECLVCHAPAAVEATDRTDFSALLSEGVGCESCHGAAREWLVPHRAVEWNLSHDWPGSRKADAGFVETKQIAMRIDRCADCHVGNETQSVNHDLIAAGHPRLAFEFAAYQSRMPIHWRQGLERQRSPVANSSFSSNRSTYEARNWLIGQIVNVDHELKILAAAAKSRNTNWPELAQYDCFACHHELSSPGWRQARSAWNLRPGELPWGTWNLGLIEEAQLPILGDRFTKDQKSLRDKMKTLSPDRNEVLSLVSILRHELSQANGSLLTHTFAPEEFIAIRARLLSGWEDTTRQGWDRSAQLFLAAVALDKGASDALGLGNRVTLAEESQYIRVKDFLSFKQTQTLDPSFHHLESPRSLELNWEELRKEFEDLKSSGHHSNAVVTTMKPISDQIPPLPATRSLETD